MELSRKFFNVKAKKRIGGQDGTFEQNDEKWNFPESFLMSKLKKRIGGKMELLTSFDEKCNF